MKNIIDYSHASSPARLPRYLVEASQAATQGDRPVILTGDRPTGPLHLGHYAGSLHKRCQLQDTYDQTILIADVQALTDNGRNPSRIKGNVLELMADYLAIGIDPEISPICLQSALPAIARLNALYLNLVTVSRLERNPTVRSEIIQKDMGKSIPAGFLTYPIHQAADITAFKASHLQVGADQLPIIEQCSEIVGQVNRLAGRPLLPKPEAILSAVTRLPGIDGKAKASKSLGNAIFLRSTTQEVAAAVKAMHTDPGHLRVSDPGNIEHHAVFAYLTAFDPHQDEIDELKAHYQRGGLGDMPLKQRLTNVLEAFLAPIRERRADLIQRPDYLMDVLREGTIKSRLRTDIIADEIEEAIGVMRLF